MTIRTVRCGMTGALVLVASLLTVRAGTPVAKTPWARPDLVEKVKRGEIRSAKVSWWGFDADDSHRWVQAALDSNAATVTLDKVASVWTVGKTVRGHSNQTFVIPEGVELQAKRGAFKRIGESLMAYSNQSDFTVTGGGTLRMWMSDYTNAALYAFSEWRMGLDISSCSRATIENVTILESGGDGIYLGESTKGVPNRQITIRNVTCRRNNRQGISVISVDGLLIENCLLEDTCGTPPMAGLDFEPNHWWDRMDNIVLRNVVSRNNRGCGFEFALWYIRGVSIRLENCRSVGNNKVAVFTPAQNLIYGMRGKIEFDGCVFDDRDRSFDNFRKYAGDRSAYSLSFTNCLAADARTGTYGSLPSDLGWTAAPEPKRPNGKPLKGLPWTAEMLNEAIVHDTKPGEAVRYSRVRSRGAATYLAYVPRAGRVTLKAVLSRIGSSSVRKGKMTVTMPSGEVVATLPNFETLTNLAREICFDVPARGFYLIKVDSGSHGFSFVEGSVPLALTSDESTRACGLNGGDCTFYLRLPKKTRYCGVVGTGGGGVERVRIRLTDPSGACVWDEDNVGSSKGHVVRRPMPGVWKVQAAKPSRYGFDDYAVDVFGVPTFFFLSAEKTWECPPPSGRRVRRLVSWTCDGEPVTVPHTWNARDGADGPCGVAQDKDNSVGGRAFRRCARTYRTRLPRADEGRRYFVRCEGAAVRATVAVNGRMAGTHRGAVTAFAHEITPFLKQDAENALEIVVDNFFDENEPPVYGDYSLEGGLYRPVWLIETDSVCIDPTVLGGPGVEIAADSVSGKIDVKAHVSGTNVHALSYAIDGRTVREPRVESPQLWSPEKPHLYDLAVTVSTEDSVDTVHQKIGFRRAEFRADGFYLNGVKRKLRGVNYHQEREGKGWALTDADIEEDLTLIKKMGADAMRGTHYPHSRTCYDLCDEKGLLCWVEIPASSLVHTNAVYLSRLRETVREMIAQNRNRPSLLAWSLFNELYSVWDGHVMPPGTGETVVRELQALVKKLDPAHPTVCASAYINRTELNGISDLYAFNTYPGWYWMGCNSHSDDIPTLIGKQLAESGCRTKTLAIGEYGAGGSIRHHENPLLRRPIPRSRFHPEEAETAIHVTEYRHILKDPRVWGSFIWMMFDTASDNRDEGDHDGINDKGLMTHDHKTPKDAYCFYKANWNPEPMLHVCSKRMTRTSGTHVTVLGFSNVGDVTLFVNRVKVGTKRPDAVHTVRWENVALSAGDNLIELRGGDRSDVWRLTRATDGVTAGWEDLAEPTREFPETEVVWHFSDTKTGDWTIERRHGAEGCVEIRAGAICVQKTNDVGEIVIKAKPFAAEKGRELAFAADVEVDGTDWSLAKGMLRAHGEKESFDFCKLDEEDGRWGNRCIMWDLPNSVPGQTYRKYAQHISEGRVTPVIVIGGTRSRSVWRNWLAEDRQRQRQAWRVERERRNAANRFAETMIDEATFDAALAADCDHTASVVRVDGYSALLVDGRQRVPMVYRGKHSLLGTSQTELFFGKRLQDEGLKLQIVDVRFGPCGGDMGFWTKDGFDLAGMVKDIKDAMRISPESLFMLALGCTVYPEFVEEENPKEVWLTKDGAKAIGHGSSAIKYVDKSINAGNRKWEWPSMASRKYRDGICARIRELVRELKRQGLTKRIVGIQTFGYHDAQFTIALSDHSQPAKAEYRRYLAEGGHASTNYEFYVRQLGFRAQEEFAHVFRNELGKDILAAMWWESPLRGRPASSWNLGSFLRSDVMNVIVAQPWYEHRNPAIVGGSHPPFASMHLHGKLFWDEYDLRTHEIIEKFRQGPAAIPGGGVSADLSMWRTIFRKLAGVAIANDMGCWFYEKAGGGFSTPSVSADIGKEYRLWQEVLACPRHSWRPSVAIVADEAGVWGWPEGEAFDWPRVEKSYFDQLPVLEASGVPFDIYLLEDALRNPAILQAYKVLLFAHLRKVDAPRARLLAQLKNEKKRMVFLGGAGELGGRELLPTEPLAPGGLSAAAFNRLTGEAGGYVALVPNAAQVEMNGRFASVHALKNGPFDLRLPFVTQVRNLKSGRLEAVCDGKVRLQLTAGETCHFAWEVPQP